MNKFKNLVNETFVVSLKTTACIRYLLFFITDSICHAKF